MSIRLAIYQRENRPFDGLCAQLQCAGYDVFERFTESAFLDLLDEQGVDILLLDADAERTESLLDEIKASPERYTQRIMLIAEQETTLPEHLSADLHSDDIIVLPILRDDLRSRVRAIARFTSIAAESERRCRALADFGITARPNDRPASAAGDRAQILLVGPIGDQQVSLVDMLCSMATFTYAETPDQALQQLRQGRVDVTIVSSDLPQSAIRQLCREAEAIKGLADLPVLISGNPECWPNAAVASRNENIGSLRPPFQAAGLQRRIQMMARQHHLKRQLRGVLAEGVHASTVDNLTGLYSHGFLHHYLECSLEQSRERDAVLSVATCTISGLANVNDMLGYAAGDHVIGQIGKALATSCRAQDLVARSGSTRFCIVLSDTSETEARTVCERVTKILEGTVGQSSGNRLAHIHLTIGMAETVAGDTAETLIKRAFQQPTVVALREAS